MKKRSSPSKNCEKKWKNDQNLHVMGPQGHAFSNENTNRICCGSMSPKQKHARKTQNRIQRVMLVFQSNFSENLKDGN